MNNTGNISEIVTDPLFEQVLVMKANSYDNAYPNQFLLWWASVCLKCHVLEVQCAVNLG